MRSDEGNGKEKQKKPEPEKDAKGDIIGDMYQQYECQACFVLSFDYPVEVYKDKERISA